MDFTNTFVPSVAEGNGRGSTDIFSRLLNDRIVFVYNGINEGSASVICAQLLVLQAENSTKPVHMYISSPGGSVYDCISIVDTMACMSYPIHTYAMGLVASAGAVILAAGQRGHRYALNNARIMIHQPTGGFRGQATDIEIQTKEILHLKNSLTKFMADRALKDASYMKELMERDKFFCSHEAKEMGLVDHIIQGSHDKQIDSATS